MEKRLSGGRVRVTRRRVLAASGTAMVALAGCVGGGESGPRAVDAEPFGSPLESSAISWDDLGDLEGELSIYSGRTRDQIDPLFHAIEEEYDGFDLSIRHGDNTDLLNLLGQEGRASPADVFYSQDAGALAEVKADELAQELPTDITDAIEGTYRDDDAMWVGASGRVRAIQFNTERWEDRAEALPDDIMEYAYDERFENQISMRPNSGTSRAFVAAMLELEGESATRDWISAMVEDQNATFYGGGSEQARAVRDGDQTIALGNQYYAGRILAEEPDAPLDVAFTEDDAGCLFNVSGVAILDSASDGGLAAEFCRHLLATEAQEFFVETNGEYPVVDGVDYVGDLPALEEINPPEFNLSTLNLELQEVRDLMDELDMVVGR